MRYSLDKLLVFITALELYGQAFIKRRAWKSPETIKPASSRNPHKASYYFDTSVVFSNTITAQYSGLT